MNASNVPVCVWSYDDDDFWKTDCGNAFVLNEGTPVENDMRFCPYCGGKLVEHKLETDEVPNAALNSAGVARPVEAEGRNES